ncbi:hypothetical protein JCM8547_008189 [Rhodosporidiobolus lusitaniae]
MSPPALLAYLASSLSSSPSPGTHNYHLAVTRSQSQRSHALFPHATNARHAKVYHQEVLVVLSEKRDIPPHQHADEGRHDANDVSEGQQEQGAQQEARTGEDEGTAASFSSSTLASVPVLPSVLADSAAPIALPSAPPTAPPADASPGIEKRTSHIPLVALEATLYHIPSSRCTLVYISKVDTTGLSPSSSSSLGSVPTRTLTAAFLSYHLLYPSPPGTPEKEQGLWRSRIHLFARSQGQYLFPGSVDNKGKRVLDDKGLLRWWKGTAERAVLAVEAARAVALPVAQGEGAAAGKKPDDLRMFYLIPGLTHLESLPYVPPSPLPSLSTSWTYSHPYSTLTSPLHPPSIPLSSLPLTDHLPSFPDDPKSRFLHSLTSSTVSPSGTPGDWDDVHLSLSSHTITTGQAPGARKAAVEADLQRERKRLVEGVPGGVEEWWERMAFRQECCSGVLVGFFTLASGEPSPSSSLVSSSSSAPPPSPSKFAAHPRPQPYPLALPPPLFTKLWSAFHNQDYSLSALPKLAEGAEKWRSDVERVAKAEWSESRRAGAGDDGEAKEKEEQEEDEWKKVWEREAMRTFMLLGPEKAEGQGEKRKAEEEKPKVNTLMVRKKKKPKVEA